MARTIVLAAAAATAMLLVAAAPVGELTIYRDLENESHGWTVKYFTIYRNGLIYKILPIVPKSRVHTVTVLPSGCYSVSIWASLRESTEVVESSRTELVCYRSMKR